MNASSAQDHANCPRAGGRWLWALGALLISLVAITPGSLWNDEALTAMKAMQSSFHDWWQAMLVDKASDLQMPLYMIYVWGFAKIFGISEFALRVANIPWFAAGTVAFMTALPGSKKISLALVAFLSPFAWYYLSEARPYAMQLSASLMIVAALYRLSSDFDAARQGGRSWFTVFCFGVVALSGSSLLGMIWAGAACLAVPVLLPWKRCAELLRAQLVVLIPTVCLLAGIGFYYLWTLKVGARASDVGRTDARNVLFIIYELLGFGGLGPGRLDIREGGFHAFMPYAKWLVVYGIIVCVLLFVGLARACRERGMAKTASLTLVIALPAVIIFGAGYVKEFRVLGRHFMPLLPVVWLGLWAGLKECSARSSWMFRPIVCGFAVLSLMSCLSFRFAARHERDDYAGAAQYANRFLRGDHTVWWNAGKEGAIYYSIPVVEKPVANAHVFWLMNPAQADLQNLPLPELIISSKPDVYDVGGVVAQFIAKNGYGKVASLPAFTIWERIKAPNAISSPKTGPRI